MTTADLFKSRLWREFEATAKEGKQSPIDVLAELMAEYIESRADSALFDAMEKEGIGSGFDEDDAVEIVCQARREKMRG